MSVILTNQGCFVQASLIDGAVYCHLSDKIIYKMYEIPALNRYIAKPQIQSVRFGFGSLISILKATNIDDEREYILIIRANNRFVSVVDAESNLYYKEIDIGMELEYVSNAQYLSFYSSEKEEEPTEINVTEFNGFTFFYNNKATYILKYNWKDYYNLILSFNIVKDLLVYRRDSQKSIVYKDYVKQDIGGSVYACGDFV